MLVQVGGGIDAFATTKRMQLFEQRGVATLSAPAEAAEQAAVGRVFRHRTAEVVRRLLCGLVYAAAATPSHFVTNQHLLCAALDARVAFSPQGLMLLHQNESGSGVGVHGDGGASVLGSETVDRWSSVAARFARAGPSLNFVRPGGETVSVHVNTLATSAEDDVAHVRQGGWWPQQQQEQQKQQQQRGIGITSDRLPSVKCLRHGLATVEECQFVAENLLQAQWNMAAEVSSYLCVWCMSASVCVRVCVCVCWPERGEYR